jgi:DHA1 family bicyclomycin/chloramphenicol resistance-like MFS transporter
MLRPDTFALTALLAALTALAPLSTDLYLPTLPDIGRAFGVSPAQVQLTLSGYLMGFALGQVAYGPISDRHGRRSGLVIALGCYCLGSLGCLLAPSIEALIGARVLQAFGGSGALVLARAVVRDLYSGSRAGKELSLMGLVMAFGPVTAPLIGGLLHLAFGWRSAFAALLAFGLVLIVMVARKMPETLGERAEERVTLLWMLRVYRALLRNREFNLYLGLGVASYTGLFAWLSASPFVLQSLYGLSPLAFAIYFTFGSLGFLVGASIATNIVLRIGIVRTIRLGTLCMVAGGLVMCAVTASGIGSAELLTAGMALFLVGFGLAYPQAVAGGLSCVAERAGAASSLLGVAPQFSAAALGAGVVALSGRSAWALSIAVLVMALVVAALGALLHNLPARAASN